MSEQTSLVDVGAQASGGVVRAEELAKKHRDIGVAEFFARNRHLLGYDNKRKALMTTIKEAVDNALDACEEARILPEVYVEVIDMGNDRFKVIVEDNGPGIIKRQIPKIFAKLLYGSKFHSLKQSRGQQGIGISAAVMYSQLTTGRATKIISRISEKHPANYCELRLDTADNKPDIVKEDEVEWSKEHGTRIEIDIEATYQQGGQSIDEYLKETAITNPHATIIYTNPKAQQFIFSRVVDVLPPEPVEIKPHPYGVELGMLFDMLKSTESKTLQAFLTNEFVRVGAGTAKQICENAALLPSTKPENMSREMVEVLMNGIQKTKLMAPPTDCISPIGAEAIENGLRKEIPAEFVVATSRPPAVYRGNPFVVECGLAYGGQMPNDSPAKVLRFANRVPLLYQQGACAITKSVINTGWRSYGIQQSKGALPVGPLVIMVHIASVWVPFTSESKEAVAHYPDVIKEIKLALQDCGRKLGMYVRKKHRVKESQERVNLFERYIPEVAEALANLTGEDRNSIVEGFIAVLEVHKHELNKFKALQKEAEDAYESGDDEPEDGIELKGNYDDEEGDHDVE